MKKQFVVILLLCASACMVFAQQMPDTAFHYQIARIKYPGHNGPLVAVDAGHHNFHTKQGGFAPFCKLLEQDGFKTKSADHTITHIDSLKKISVLVIVNPLHASNVGRWFLPTPSAFTADEIKIIQQWVHEGGRLLLIADHMPFAGAAYELGKIFGFEFINGFADTGEKWPPSSFTSRNNKLGDCIITQGGNENEKIDSVFTFTGSGFKMPDGATAVLKFDDDDFSLQPDTAWRFHKNTPTVNLTNHSQGAVMNVGRGKIAMFGEAAMFTAQVVNNKTKVGINSPLAPNNAQFVLNLLHWLAE